MTTESPPGPAALPQHRIQCRAVDCARITPDALENMRRRMSPQEFAREFECVFTAEPDQFITEERFDSAVRDDIEPMFEDILEPDYHGRR